MGLKNIYYFFENKWYDFVEKTGLYKVTDKIDKVMPSFLLFILIIIMLIAGIFLMIPSIQGKGEATISFSVLDDEGNSVPLAPIMVSTETDNFRLTTDDYGTTEPISLKKDSEIYVSIDYSGSNYEKYSNNFVISDNQEIVIYLDNAESETQKVNYNFSLVDSLTSANIPNDGSIVFSCRNLGPIAPGTVTVIGGVVEVQADSACQLVAQSISIQGYETKYGVSISPQTSMIDLTKLSIGFEEQQTYSLYISVNNEAGNPLSSMQAKLYQNNVEIIGGNCLTANGVCTITGLESGSYTLKVTDTRTNAEYGQAQSSVYISSNTNQPITMTRNIAGYILVKVKKSNNQAISGATVTLKYIDNDNVDIASYTTDSDGQAYLAVYDLTKRYRVVVDKEDYLIASQSNIVAVANYPTNPTVTITLQQITPTTAAQLKLRVINSETGKGFPNAQVVLYSSDTGFLTDYKPKMTNSDGNVTFVVSSGNYYAKAFKGSSIGLSEEFEFNVRDATTAEAKIIPMEITKGNLLVTVVDKDGEAVPHANILLFDRYNSRTPIWGGDLANIDGTYEITEIVSDQDVYVVVSDIISNLGSTQSEFVYIKPNETNELKVTLYNKINASQKPKIEFLGFFNDSGSRLNGYIRSGAEYKAKFLLLIPSERWDSDLEEFEEVGAILRTGSSNTPYMENDSIYIKDIVLPNSEIQKFTQYSSEDGYDGKDDVDTRTEGDAKWAKVIFNPINNRDYATAYTIMADLKVKDDAAYGEKVDIHYLGFGYNEDEEYESDPVDNTNNDDVEYMTYKTESFNIGEEQACSDDFCFTLNITNLDEDLREDVVDNYNAKPQQNYKLRFGLINNNKDRIYTNNSRFEIKNADKGLIFKDINFTQPNSSHTNINVIPDTYEYKITTQQFNPHSTISGEIQFVPSLKGDRQILLQYVSDQRIVFTRLINIHVLSDKTFKVEITPEVIPSGKNFNLELEIKDEQTGIEVDKQVTVSVKDRFKKDLISNVLVGALGKVSITNIPGQETGNKVYVYVQAPEYETHISEIEVTENIFKVTPTKIGVSLNINTKTEETAKFTIENLSENSLVIESIRFVGDETKLESLDIARINTALSGYYDIEIPGIVKDETTYNNKKEIDAKFFTSPRAQTLKEVKNLSSNLVIKLRDKYNKQYSWEMELPVTITVGFEGLMDNSNCITLSEGMWETTVVDKYVDTQFTLKNNCGVNSRPVPLNGGLSAKVEFEGNPLGVFTVDVGTRKVELSHGYFKSIYDTVDSEKVYSVNLRYTPVGRYTGDIKGKIIFRSLNTTNQGSQELLTEYKFTLHVVSLSDCYVLSKKVLTAKETGEADSFTIENKNCGSQTVYRLSCDECNGLVLNPKENITVPATGSSEEIKVMSMGAMPGVYLLNVYSKVGGARGHERNVGKVRVEVRPNTQCLDLDRYEYDLYRYQYSENTGQEVKAKSFDTGNIINRCYGQTVKVQGEVKDSAKWQVALFNGVRDGLFTGATSGLINAMIPDKNAECNTGILGIGKKACPEGFDCKSGKCVAKEVTPPVNNEQNQKNLEKVCNPACADTHECVNGACQLKVAINTGTTVQYENAKSEGAACATGTGKYPLVLTGVTNHNGNYRCVCIGSNYGVERCRSTGTVTVIGPYNSVFGSDGYNQYPSPLDVCWKGINTNGAPVTGCNTSETWTYN